MTPSDSPDVLIVGGSLVGLSTALFLRLHGVSCLAVERHTSTAIHPRAGHFQLRTIEILRSAGLEDAVRRRGEEQYHPNGGITSGMEMGFHLLRRAGYDEAFVADVARVMEYTGAYDVYRDDVETAQTAAAL